MNVSPLLVTGQVMPANPGRIGARREIAIKLGNHSCAGNRDRGVSEEWRDVGEGGIDGEPCQHTHNAAL